ncbi:aspartyl protease family protein [Plebeiibacterium sediminum]|uniref:Aspartyl protease family protein n=1 Tax=Plebeiibacterium sediminum TaxID=2992112 RepID=A0AAE3M913_9BACT|nr:aspartyl protease family protein [Plebeiobacterium sediminum]MCW3789231.1 aspartyl protease family protein [Plebeiobacterium sediminum]
MKTIFLLLFIPISIFAQNPIHSLNYGTISPCKYNEEIPFDFFQGHIIINVTIEGKSFRFMMDTGAATGISASLYDELKPPVFGKIEISDANNEKDSTRVTVIESLKLGDITFKDAAAIVYNDNLIFDCFELDGVLGSNSLRNSVVQFDYPNRIIKITDSPKKLNLKSKYAQQMDLSPFQSNPYFYLYIKGKQTGKVHLLFDSGMDGLLDISLNNYHAFKEHDIFEKVLSSNGNNTIGFYGLTDDTMHYKINIKSMVFKKMELNNITANTTKDLDTRIGAKVLQYALVTLDYKNGKIYFEPNGNDLQDSYVPKFPLEPDYKEGKFQIGFIWCPEKVPNIHKGDEILFVNDISCKDKSMCEVFNLMHSFSSDEMKLVTLNESGEECISIIKKE